MFRKTYGTLIIVGSCLVLSPSFAEDKSKESKPKSEYHCEKVVDGETTDLKDVKTRGECKKQGGKWKKHHENGHNHDHGSEDSHKHHEE